MRKTPERSGYWCRGSSLWKKRSPAWGRSSGAVAGAKPFCFQSRHTPPRELGEGTWEKSGFGFVEKLLCLPLRSKSGGEGAARATAASPLCPRRCWGAAFSPLPWSYGRFLPSLPPATQVFLLCLGPVLHTSIPTHWVPRWTWQEVLGGIEGSQLVSIINPPQWFSPFSWCKYP